MKFDRNIHKRKSIRLKKYDYSSEWLYFVTISIKDKLCLLWNISDSNLELFESWKMIEKYWLDLENKFNNIKLHNYIVIPNHFHGIIEIKEKNKNCDCKKQGNHKGYPYDKFQNVGAMPCACPNSEINRNNKNRKYQNTIWNIIGWFKSITTNEYIKNVKNNNWLPFNKKLWQRNYYEHIIRNEKSYLQIIEYIENNHLKWDEDRFYYIEI